MHVVLYPELNRCSIIIGGVAYVVKVCGLSSGSALPIMLSKPYVPVSPPPPPPPEVHNPYSIEYEYILYIPRVVASNMNVYVHDENGIKKIIPSDTAIWTVWQRYPTLSACPQIIQTTHNPYVSTELKRFKYADPCNYDFFKPDIIAVHSNFLYVLQFVFLRKRWIVMRHEIEFLLPGSFYQTIEKLKLWFETREEKLMDFYDSEMHGFGEFSMSMDMVIDRPNEVIIALGDSSANILLDQAYTLQPSSNFAYAMFIIPPYA